MKVDFPLIIVDLPASYSKSSFRRNSENLIQEKKNWNSHFRPFSLVVDVYILLALIERQVFRSFWKVSQFNMIYSFRDIRTFKIIYKVQKRHFWALPIVWGLCRSQNTQSKSILAVFWGVSQLYTTSGSRDMENHATSSLWGPQNKKFLGHFRLLEGYTYLRTFIVD